MRLPLDERLEANQVLTYEEKLDLVEGEAMLIDYGRKGLVDQAIIGVKDSPSGGSVAVYEYRRLLQCVFLEQWLEEVVRSDAPDIGNFDPAKDYVEIKYFDDEFFENNYDNIAGRVDSLTARYSKSHPIIVYGGDEPNINEEGTQYSFRGRRMRRLNNDLFEDD